MASARFRLGTSRLTRGAPCDTPRPALRLLTPTEMKVLLQLAQRAGEPVQRGDVMAGVWGDSYGGESNIVDVYVRRLRRKLERDPRGPC